MAHKMHQIQIDAADLPALQQMVLRGWSQGDLADFISADQINACERVLAALGLDVNQADPLPGGHSQPQPPQALARR